MRKRSAPTTNANHDAFRRVFVRHVHQLLDSAYHRMKPVRKWGLMKEEDISGEIARQIDIVLDELTEPWMRFFSLEPERHVDEPQVPLSKRRLGKHRRRMDFRFRCRQRRPALRFVYEAKLLSDSGSYQDLIGENGLGRFLTKKYAVHDLAAGLLAFVAVQTEDAHSAKVREAFEADPGRYGMPDNGKLIPVRWKLASLQSYCSTHQRVRGAEILIYHSYLRFY